MNGERRVQLCVVPTYYPCGEQSTCCGPIGLSEGEIAASRAALTEAVGSPVEIVDLRDEERMAGFPAVGNLVRRYGLKGIPTIAVDDEVVAMGSPTPADAATEIREWLNARASREV